MAIVFAENVIECAMHGSYSGRPIVNVLHVRNDEQGGSDLSKVTDVRNNWQDHILDVVSDQYTFSHIEWRSLDPDDNNVGTLQPDGTKPQQGALSAAGAPASVAYLVKKNTTNRPRGRRDGRIYLAGVPEGQVNEAGVLLSTQVAAVNTALAAFLAGVNDDTFGLEAGSYLCVLETTPASRQAGTNEVTIGHRPVTSLTCDNRVATQRERLR